MLRTLAKLLAVLNSETAPIQISAGIALGMVMGLSPLFAPHNLLVLLLALLLRVNLSGFLVGFAVFSGVAYLLDPLFHALGLWLLEAPALFSLWTTLYGSAFWRFVEFNDSIVLGSLAFCAVAFAPFVLLGNALIRRYRTTLLAWVRRSRIMIFLRATRFWGLYQSMSGTVRLP